MLLTNVIATLNEARSFGAVASALNSASAFLTRCCVLEFEFGGSYYSIYPTEVEAYCHNDYFPDPYTHCHDAQRNNYGRLYFHGAGMDLCLSLNNSFLSFLIRSAYVIRDGHNIISDGLPVVGPIRLRESIFGRLNATQLRQLPIADAMVLRESDSESSPDRFYTMIATRVGLVHNTAPQFAELRLRTISDSTMRKRDYRPKEQLLDSYLEIVRLTPEQRYQVVRRLMDRCPSKYMLKK